MKFNGGAVMIDLHPTPPAARTNNTNPPSSLLPTDLEFLLREINDFCSLNPTPTEIPKVLDDYLNYVAKTGNIVFPWSTVKGLFRSKLTTSLNQFPGPPGTDDEQQVFNRFDLFRSAPFTIQRLTELINNPTYHYKLKEKYLFALEKTVFVVSTVEPFDVNPVANGSEKNGEDSDTSTTDEVNSTFTVDHEDAKPKDQDGPDSEMERQEVPTEMEISKEEEEPISVTTVLPPTTTQMPVEGQDSVKAMVKVTDDITAAPVIVSIEPTSQISSSSEFSIITEAEMIPIATSVLPKVDEFMGEVPVEVAKSEPIAKEDLVEVVPESGSEGIVAIQPEVKGPAQTDEESKMIVEDIQAQPEQETETEPTTTAPNSSNRCNLFLCKKASRKWDTDLY